ncbi:MAG: hypothetical protein NVSMB68_02950 [Thermoanaerobaculia bacterium]
MNRLLFITLFFVSTASFGSVVLPIGAAPQVLIPAAGSTAGANGTFFRSDISIVNLSSHDQTVVLQWLPQAGAGTNSSATITMRALTGLRSADFVNEYLRQSGLGAIVITGTTAGGFVDSTARLYVSSRIWSPQPGTAGTVSQSFPAIPVSSINTQIAALFGLSGADNPGNYRVNVGVVNLDPANPQTFFIGNIQHLPVPIQQTVTLPPMTMQQVSLGNAVGPTEQISIQNITPAATKSNLWTAYGSTVDNVTGDAFSELAVAGTTAP